LRINFERGALADARVVLHTGGMAVVGARRCVTIIMAEIWTMGELLCEVMRPEADMRLDVPGVFYGPYPSGAPAIFIDTVARLGHTAGIVGGVGKDDFGKCIIDRLERDGVDCSQITQYDDGTTGVAFVTYFGDGSRRFLYHFPDTPATRATAPDIGRLGCGGAGSGGSGNGSIGGDSGGSGARYFHIMGCSLMAKESFGREILKLMRDFAQNGVKISFDPNIRAELMRDESVYKTIDIVMQNCSVFMPGVSELLTISGKDTVEDAVRACFGYPSIEVIALKNGAEGCVIYTRDDRFAMGAYAVDAVDPTGAGDCFDGAFLCGLLDGLTLREAARLASAAAALNAAAFGPMEGDINRDSVKRLIENNEKK
jgi:sugar/nucleoside kinase (ribokinase family)